MKTKTISATIHFELCRLLEEFDASGTGTKLERKARNLLENIYNEWEYIVKGE